MTYGTNRYGTYVYGSNGSSVTAAFSNITVSDTSVAIGQLWSVVCDISGLTGTDYYLRYQASGVPSPLPSATGVSLDLLILPPTETDWANAWVQPGFYGYILDDYDVATKGGLAWQHLKSTATQRWRARFVPHTNRTYDDASYLGDWQIKLRVQDAGTPAYTTSSIYHITVTARGT